MKYTKYINKKPQDKTAKLLENQAISNVNISIENLECTPSEYGSVNSSRHNHQEPNNGKNKEYSWIMTIKS